jgi:hypothetical protein
MAKVVSEKAMIAALKRRFDEADAQYRRYRSEDNDKEAQFYLGRSAGLADALDLLDQPFS